MVDNIYRLGSAWARLVKATAIACVVETVADLRFDKGGFKSKIRMCAHFLLGAPPF